MEGYWVCDACHSLNEPRNTSCYKCRVKRGQAKPQPIIPGAKAGPAASTYVGTGAFDDRGEPSLMAAVVFGAAMAALVTAGWYIFEAGIRFGQGRVAWVTGVLIGITVLAAGTLGGHRRVSFLLTLISFVLTLAAVFIGEYLIISNEIAVAAGGAGGAMFIATPDEVMAVAGDYFTHDPLRPILWAFALGAGWLIPWGALVGTTEKED